MESKPKSTWARLMKSLDQYATALAYEPEDELFRRVARLEEQVQSLRRGSDLSTADTVPHKRR